MTVVGCATGKLVRYLSKRMRRRAKVGGMGMRRYDSMIRKNEEGGKGYQFPVPTLSQ